MVKRPAVSRAILIVEDSPQMATNLEIALAGLDGLDIRVAGSGAEALSLLDEPAVLDVAAVVTDLEMPKLDGYELIERLRADPRFERLPIIVSSGSSDPDWPAKARRLGANACFLKPYSPLELKRRLKSLLEENKNA